MPAEPGPIEVLDLAQFDLGPLPPGAALPTLPEEAEFDALALELEHDLAELAGGLGQDWRTELELLHVEAEEGVYHDPLTVADDDLAIAEAAAAEADAKVVGAYDEIPGEAWQDLPEHLPYVIGVPGGAVPTPLPAPGVPAPTPTPTPTPTPGPLPEAPTVRVLNVTRGGEQNFWVGDEWRLEITGGPLETVTCTGYHEQTPFGPTSFGLTDSLGRWVLQGAMSEYERGYWIQEWRVGGVLCEPVLVFLVL